MEQLAANILPKISRAEGEQVAIKSTLEDWRDHFERYHKRKSISTKRLEDGSYRYPAVQQRWQAYYAHRVNLLQESGKVRLAKLMADRQP